MTSNQVGRKSKSNFCPGWAEVKNHFAAICTEVDKTTSTHVVLKLDLRKNKAPTFDMLPL